MASEPTSSEESNMSQSGPRNFYCHQCSSRTRISIEEFTCSSCGSGFIEEIVESDADESRDLGQGGNSDDPWAHDTETDGEPEMFRDTAAIFDRMLPMLPQMIAPRSGPRTRSQSTRSSTTTRPGIPRPGGRTSIELPSLYLTRNDPLITQLDQVFRAFQQQRGPFEMTIDALRVPGFSGSNIIHGNPGDYAWGRSGLDQIVTRLLSQMEGAGPPKMEKEEIQKVPIVKVGPQHIDQKAQCSVCWEDFKLDESVNQLQCEHIFHKDCITPWLELHATCPVCRKPQNEAAAAHSRQAQNEANSERDSNVNVNSSSLFGSSSNEYNDSPMTDDRTSQDATPSTSISASARQPNSTTNSSSLGSNEPSTVPAGAEAGYSLGNPLSSIFNQFFGNGLTSISIRPIRQTSTSSHVMPVSQNTNNNSNINTESPTSVMDTSSDSQSEELLPTYTTCENNNNSSESRSNRPPRRGNRSNPRDETKPSQKEDSAFSRRRFK